MCGIAQSILKMAPCAIMQTPLVNNSKSFLEHDKQNLDSKHGTKRVQRNYAFAVGSTNGFADSIDRIGCKWTKDGYGAVFGKNGRFTHKGRTETPIHPRWKRDMEEGCASCAARTMRWEWQTYYYERVVKPEEVFIDSDEGIKNFDSVKHFYISKQIVRFTKYIRAASRAKF